MIWVASGGMYGQRLRADDLEYEHGEYKPTTGYARTKRAQVVLSELWAEELREDGSSCTPCTPAGPTRPAWRARCRASAGSRRPDPADERAGRRHDRLARRRRRARLRSSGGFWHDRRERPTHYAGRTKEGEADRRALWEACERLTA